MFLAGVLVCLTSLVNSARAQTRVEGSMKLVCIPPEVLDLHFKMPSNNETLVVHIWMASLAMDGVKNTPHKSRGQSCSAENHCENVETTLRFRERSRHRASATTCDLNSPSVSGRRRL
jgi:hypothetical protein